MSRPRFYTPNEVAAHNSSSDCWVSYLGKVYDLTPLCKEHSGDVLLKPIVANAGKDISHWFDPQTKDVSDYRLMLKCSHPLTRNMLKTHVDPVIGCTVPYVPMGRFVHVPPPCPRSDWANNFGKPWWKNEIHCVGTLSRKTRRVRIINTLTLEEQIIEVCAEETMQEILNRYVPYNSHAASYTWKFFGRNLEMNKTLEDNGVSDEDQEFFELRMDEDEGLPPITLYFNDDLTEP